MVAAALANLKHGQRADRVDSSIELSTQDDAAAALNVSVSSVKRATKVRNEGTPELVTAVVKDQIAVSQAARVAEMPVDQQRAIQALPVAV